MRTAVALLALGLLLTACNGGGAGDAGVTLIQQPGQFQIEIPVEWTVILPLPIDALLAMERQDPGTASAAPLFSAASSRLSDAGATSDDGVLLAVFKAPQDGAQSSEVLNEWADRLDDAELSNSQRQQSGEQTTLTRTGTARSRTLESAQSRVGIVLSVITHRDRNAEVWMLLCSASLSAPETLMNECTDTLRSFRILPVLGTP